MSNPFQPVIFSVDSSEIAVRSALEKLKDALLPLDLGPEEIGTIEIVMAEALNNVVEHAYPKGSPGGPIRIRCAKESDGLHLKVVDEGNEMPGGALPAGDAANLDVDFEDLPEGGFGWFLIRDIAKDVTYRRVGWENHLSLRFAIAVGE